MAVVITGSNEAENGVEEMFVWGVRPRGGVGDHCKQDLQGCEGVGSYAEVGVVFEGKQGLGDGHEFRSEDRVVFIKSRGVD